MNEIRRVEKPWGFEIWWAHTDQYAGKLLDVEQGQRLSLQYHQRKDESGYLLSGAVRLSKGPGIDQLVTTLMHPGDCWHTRPSERRICSTSGKSASIYTIRWRHRRKRSMMSMRDMC